MMLKTSSRKLNPFGNMIGFTTRKNFGIIIVLCILALLYCPGSYIVNFETMYANRYTAIQINGTSAAEYTKYFGTVVMISAPLFVLLFNFLNFSFLYKKSASDVFHAFPLTRTELLLSRMISGIISSLVPVVVCSLCYVFMIIFNPWIGDFGTLLYHLAVTLTIVLIWSAFSLLFVVCAGSSFDLSLSFFGVNLAAVFIALIFDNILDETLLGYSNNSEQMLYNLSLPYFCACYEELRFWIRSIIFISGFTVATILLYNRRKAEKGGSAYAYKFMYFLCSVIAGICGGYLIGSLFDNDITSPVFWLFAAIGTILSCIIYGLITNRGFKGIFRSMLMGGMAIATMLAVMISGVTGGFGYSKRVPSAGSIKEVEVYLLGEYLTFTDPNDVIKLHEKAVESATLHSDYSDENPYATVEFCYTLKGDAILERDFQVPIAAVQDELLTIYKSQERFEQLKNESSVFSDEYTIEFIYRAPFDSYEYNGTVTEKECQQLLEAYWKDVQNLTDLAFYTDEYSENNGHISIYISDNNYGYKRHYFSLDIGAQFSNIIAYITNTINV